jgi:hypothetical protein
MCSRVYVCLCVMASTAQGLTDVFTRLCVFVCYGQYWAGFNGYVHAFMCVSNLAFLATPCDPPAAVALSV